MRADGRAGAWVPSSCQLCVPRSGWRVGGRVRALGLGLGAIGRASGLVVGLGCWSACQHVVASMCALRIAAVVARTMEMHGKEGCMWLGLLECRSSATRIARRTCALHGASRVASVGWSVWDGKPGMVSVGWCASAAVGRREAHLLAHRLATCEREAQVAREAERVELAPERRRQGERV